MQDMIEKLTVEIEDLKKERSQQDHDYSNL
jgi:hypothetical protein